MDTQRQNDFMQAVTPERHAAAVAHIESWLGIHIPYRICEMPIFVDGATRRKLEEASIALVEQCTTPDYHRCSEATLTPAFTVDRETDRPLFSVVDFAMVDVDGRLEPRLIELQGFPSLFGYQHLYATTMAGCYGLDGVSPYFSGLDESSYFDILRTAIYADADPATVALMEIDPLEQKTLSDFVAMERYIGLQTVNLRDVYVRGRALVVRRAEGERPLRRIFNRAIIDELADMGVQANFPWNADLDVAWAGHPNWYFRMSKFALPWLSHPTVPATYFLDSLPDGRTAADLLGERSRPWVLKPLYAFAGKGVVIDPTVADVDAIPAEDRERWILQERVTYAPCIPTPHGANRVEIRVMLVWLPDAERPLPVMSLARTGRGAMMGARYNVEPWTGSSGCLFTG